MTNYSSLTNDNDHSGGKGKRTRKKQLSGKSSESHSNNQLLIGRGSVLDNKRLHLIFAQLSLCWDYLPDRMSNNWPAEIWALSDLNRRHGRFDFQTRESTSLE